MKKITAGDRSYLADAASLFKKAKKVVALTGAGISVESGIDDFRSPGGLWSQFPLEEYGTLDVFRRNPEKSWQLFRKIGTSLDGKRPNRGHVVLAEFEQNGWLVGIVTQNIDNLHQVAGSKNVVEIHGDARNFQCLDCGALHSVLELLPEDDETVLPRCQGCGAIVKPNVVLFGEQVRALDDVQWLVHGCDILLVIGTSAQVYPAAHIPQQVKMSGGKIFEFNTEATVLTAGKRSDSACSDYFFQGKASAMLELLLNEIS